MEHTLTATTHNNNKITTTVYLDLIHRIPNG